MSRREPRPTPRPIQPRNDQLNEVARVALGMDPFGGTSQTDRNANAAFVQRHGPLNALFAPVSSIVQDFAAEGYAPSSTAGKVGLGTAAFIADMLNPTGWVAGAPIDKAIGQGIKIATANPATRDALLKSITGRLYHGNKGEPWRVATNRLPELRDQNWFQADLFSTPSKELASSYDYGSGVYTLRNLPEDLNVLDLMPNAPSISEQSPELGAYLRRVYGAERPVGDVGRHLPYTGAGFTKPAELGPEAYSTMSDILPNFGYNAIRHISGQSAGRTGDITAPVYVFLKPEGITATPVNNLPAQIAAFPKNVGNRIMDTAQEVLRRQDPRYMSESVNKFLDSRGQIIPAHYSSSGTPKRLSVLDSGTKLFDYRPYNQVANVIDLINAPVKAVSRAKAQSASDYARLLDKYNEKERQRIGNALINSGALQPPPPPGYLPLPAPKEPGAYDFLRYLFAPKPT